MTEHISAPTIEQLRREQKNLTEQLVYANKRIQALESIVKLWEETPLSVIVYVRWLDFLHKIRNKFKG